ncbi:MAG TPA: divergent polysaccharide deacetylase family protein [Thermoanaerobaculia bacterium]
MSRRGSHLSPATVFFALLSIALAFALYLKSCPSTPGPPPLAVRRTASPTPPSHARATLPTRHAAQPSGELPQKTPSSGGPPEVAIVIDDLGNELSSAERIAGWREPVTGAVLPGLVHSAQAARALEEGGKEILLHLPMEPEGYPRVRPGPGVILRSQSDEEIARTLESDLASVPGAVGVNNHMGSAATADPRVMRTVIRALARRGLFFLDSRTTDATVAERTAEEQSVPALSRRVFLDDDATETGVRGQLAELVRRARHERSAVAIGHPNAVTLSVLEHELPGLAQQGVRIVKVSELARKP